MADLDVPQDGDAAWSSLWGGSEPSPRVWASVPHVAHHRLAHGAGLRALAARSSSLDTEPSELAALIWATARVLERFPALNARDGAVDVAFAVDTWLGVRAPVVRAPGCRPLSEVTSEVARLSRAARDDRAVRIDAPSIAIARPSAAARALPLDGGPLRAVLAADHGVGDALPLVLLRDPARVDGATAEAFLDWLALLLRDAG